MIYITNLGLLILKNKNKKQIPNFLWSLKYNLKNLSIYPFSYVFLVSYKTTIPS